MWRTDENKKRLSDAVSYRVVGDTLIAITWGGLLKMQTPESYHESRLN